MVIKGGGDDERAEAEAAAEAAAAQDALDELAARVTAAMRALHGLQDEFEAAVKRQRKRVARGADAALVRRLEGVQRLMPAHGGLFVSAFLGGINVQFERKSQRLAFKREYELLKMKLAPGFVALCLVCLYFEENRWVHMILQLALSCYYVTLALRENILRVNGSNIKAWWITHHYITMMQGVVLLTWPNGASYASFRKGLHTFGLYNAILQIFQTRYQMSRLYTLRSLGMAGEMDVASSDSTQIHWSESMHLLLPLIIFGQLMQGYQALSLIHIYLGSPTELQILLLSLLFTANFIGNIYTTFIVVSEKRRNTRRRRESSASLTTAAPGPSSAQSDQSFASSPPALPPASSAAASSSSSTPARPDDKKSL